MKKNIGSAKTEINLKRATSSLLENSLPIFLPVKNIHKTKAHALFSKNNGSLKIETVFGVVEIRGRILGQNHKDILEMLLCQTKIGIIEDDSISVNFKRYGFLQKIGRSTGNYTWLEDRIKEIRDFSFGIVYYDKDGKKVEVGGFGIIDKYRFEDNKTLSVKFTAEFTNFYRAENTLEYAKYVPKIAKMKEPFLKALVREMLKHKDYKIHFSKLIENFAFTELLSKDEIGKYRKLLRSEEHKQYLFEKFNISVEDRETHDFLISIKRDNSAVALLENNENGYMTKSESLVTIGERSLFDIDFDTPENKKQ